MYLRQVSPRTSVTVIGDGAVGLCAVLAARRLGAERILLMGHHKERTDLGREFGATDVISERDADGVERVRELTGGDGTHAVLECVGTRQAIEMALGVTRAGGALSRVGAPQYTEVPMDFGTFLRNITPERSGWSLTATTCTSARSTGLPRHGIAAPRYATKATSGPVASRSAVGDDQHREVIRWSTAVAVVGVAATAAVASYEHAYALVRAHGEAGWAARLIPLTVDGLIYAR